MNCAQFIDALSRHAAGLQDEDTDRQIGLHRTACAACRGREEAFSGAVAALGPDFREAAGPAFAAAAWSHIERMSHRPAWEESHRPDPSGWLEGILGLLRYPAPAMALGAAVVLVLVLAPGTDRPAGIAALEVALLSRSGDAVLEPVAGGTRCRVAAGGLAVVAHGDRARISLSGPAELDLAPGPSGHLRSGEATFAVNRREAGDPYRTHAPGLEIQVLGTVYRVVARETGATVDLSEGRVQVAAGGHDWVMAPGERFDSSQPSRPPARLPGAGEPADPPVAQVRPDPTGEVPAAAGASSRPSRPGPDAAVASPWPGSGRQGEPVDVDPGSGLDTPFR